MSVQEIREMLLTVADRFSFGERELWNMPVSRLHFWHDGVIEIYEAEKEQMK